MNTQDSRSKKWKVVIPVIIIALVVGWYWFRPERLVTNRRVDEAIPAINNSAAQILESGTFHRARIQPREPQQSIVSRMGAEFFGSRTSRHLTALTFTFTWWPPKTPETTQVWNTRRSSIWDSSRGTSATKTTLSAPIWTWQSIVPCLCGANGLVRISALHH
jgi:hypothetical protein